MAKLQTNFIDVADIVRLEPYASLTWNTRFQAIRENFNSIHAVLSELFDTTGSTDIFRNGVIPASVLQDGGINLSMLNLEGDDAVIIPESNLNLNYATEQLKAMIDSIGDSSFYSAILTKDKFEDKNINNKIEAVFARLSSDNTNSYTIPTETGTTIEVNGVSRSIDDCIYIKPFIFKSNNKVLSVFNDDQLETFAGSFPVYLGTPDVSSSKVNFITMKMEEVQVALDENYLETLQNLSNVFLKVDPETSNIIAVQIKFSFSSEQIVDSATLRNYLGTFTQPDSFTTYAADTDYVPYDNSNLVYKHSDNNTFIFIYGVAVRKNSTNYGITNALGIIDPNSSNYVNSLKLTDNDIVELLPVYNINLNLQAKDFLVDCLSGKSNNMNMLYHKNNSFAVGDKFYQLVSSLQTNAKVTDTLWCKDQDDLDINNSNSGSYIGKKSINGITSNSGFGVIPLSYVNSDTFNSDLFNKDLVNNKISFSHIKGQGENQILNDSIPYQSKFYITMLNNTITMSIDEAFGLYLFSFASDISTLAASVKSFLETNLDKINVQSMDTNAAVSSHVVGSTVTTIVESSQLKVTLTVDDFSGLADGDIVYVSLPMDARSGHGFSYNVNKVDYVLNNDLLALVKEDIYYKNNYEVSDDNNFWSKISLGNGNFRRFAANIDYSRNYEVAGELVARQSALQVSNTGIVMHPEDILLVTKTISTGNPVTLDAADFGLDNNFKVTGVEINSLNSVLTNVVVKHNGDGTLTISATSGTEVSLWGASPIVYFSAPLFDISIINNGIKDVIDYETFEGSFTTDVAETSKTFNLSFVSLATLGTHATKVYAGPYDVSDAISSLNGKLFIKLDTDTDYLQKNVTALKVDCNGQVLNIELDGLTAEETYNYKIVVPVKRVCPLSTSDNKVQVVYNACNPIEAFDTQKYFTYDSTTDFDIISDIDYFMTNLGANLTNESNIYNALNLKHLYYNMAHKVSREAKSDVTWDENSFIEQVDSPFVILKGGLNADLFNDKIVRLISTTKDLSIASDITSYVSELKAKIFNVKNILNGNTTEIDGVSFSTLFSGTNADYDAVLIAIMLVKNRVTKEVKLMVVVNPILNVADANAITSSSDNTKVYLSSLGLNYVL